MHDLPTLFGTGLGLAAGAGLNAYAVLFVYGGLARLFPEEFPGALAHVLSSNAVLVTVFALFLLEFVVDKIPGLDHAWDLLHAVVRPFAGGVLTLAATSPHGDSTLVGVLAGGSGGIVALASHLLKTTMRLTSTALTAGIANAALSLAEDIVAFLVALVSIFLPLLALCLVLAFAVLFVITVPRIARSVDLFGRRRRPKEKAA